MAGRSIDKYSIDITGENPYSEQSYANIVAKKFNSNHYTKSISDNNFEEYFVNNYSILDEPLATQDFVALNHLSKLTRDNNTIVVQVGEGSDELFMGYEGFLIKQTSGRMRHITVNFSGRIIPSLMK